MAENVGEIFVELTLDGNKFNAELKRTEQTVASSSTQMKNSLESGPGSAIDFLKAKFAQLALVTAGAAGFMGFKNLISESTMLAARVETLGVVVNVVGRNLGYSSDQMSSFVESVKKMGITTQEASQGITRMAQANLDLNKASQLARVAQDAAVIGNINSSEAMNRMIHGIVTLQPEILRTIGITVSFEQEYRKAALTLGKSAEALTQNEKQAIALNATLREGAKIAGVYEEAMGTVGKQINSLPRFIEEAKVAIGEFFKPLLGEIVMNWMDSLKKLNKWFEEMRENGELAIWVKRLTETMKDLGKAVLAVTAVLATRALFNSLVLIASGADLANAAFTRMLVTFGKLSLYMGAGYLGAQLGYWITGQTAAYNKYNKEVEESNRLTRENAKWMVEQIKLKAALNEAAEKQIPWETMVTKLNLKERGDVSQQQYENLSRTYAIKLKEAYDQGIDEARGKFSKEKPKIEFELSVVGESDFNKKILQIQFEANKEWKENQMAGAEARELIEKTANAKIIEEYRKFDLEYKEITLSYTLDRQKRIEEAQLTAGKLSTMPTALLAEEDARLKKQLENYKGHTDKIEALTKESEQKKLDIMREWNIKRLEVDKTATEKQIENLTKYREALVAAYEKASNKVKEYQEQLTKIDEVMNRSQTFLKGLGKQDTKSLFEEEKEIRKIMVAAQATKDFDKINDAMQKYEAFIAKNKDTKSPITGWTNDFMFLTAEYKKLQSEMEAMGKAAETAKTKEENNMRALLIAINDVDQKMIELNERVKTLDYLITQTKNFNIDITSAMASLAIVEGRIRDLMTMMSMATTTAGSLALGRNFGSGGSEVLTTGSEEYAGMLSAGQGFESFNSNYAGSVGTPGGMTAEEYAAELGYPPAALGAYVRKTGLALVHKDETISPPGKGKEISINMGGITINGVDNPKELARLIVKPLQAEMRMQGLLN